MENDNKNKSILYIEWSKIFLMQASIIELVHKQSANKTMRHIIKHIHKFNITKRCGTLVSYLAVIIKYKNVPWLPFLDEVITHPHLLSLTTDNKFKPINYHD